MTLEALLELVVQLGPTVAFTIYLLLSSEKDKEFLKKQLEDANTRNNELESSHKRETDSLKEALDNNTLALNNLINKLGGLYNENL